MDRRSFVQGVISTLLTYSCSFARPRAATAVHGCRTAASGRTLGVTLRSDDFDPRSQHMLTIFKSSMSDRFGVRPGISYYDDGDAPNALAYPRGIFPDGWDGTV